MLPWIEIIFRTPSCAYGWPAEAANWSTEVVLGMQRYGGVGTTTLHVLFAISPAGKRYVAA